MNNIIKVIQLLALCAILSHSLNTKFTITKHYVEDQTATIVSLGTITIFQEGEINQAYVEPHYPTFITKEDVERSKAVILSFKEESTGIIFTTAVNKLIESVHSEKIVILTSSDEQIIGFNYVQTRMPNQDISVDFMGPDRGVEHIFKVEPQNKPQQQEQSFFQKYKWPLIIGGVILYLSMSMDPEKMQQAQAQAQARQA